MRLITDGWHYPTPSTNACKERPTNKGLMNINSFKIVPILFYWYIIRIKKSNFLANFIISVDVIKAEKINLGQNFY